ncbi:macrophage colony-stimulating factor 1 receptor 2 isoform X2 [Mugil cephalus]|uniref:macrophage colony-stimulating factor 1 receptor 2 isoform X2 n=1 Tax=Mugil cephalus TaxID=48193 RepID=UPI001FB82CAA|nr:macrophage colony-stimulating factor 1 receptor 2 isoform X2 [Mugil cephalus]
MRPYSLLLSIALSCCCSAAEPDPPSIRLNSDFLPNRSEVVLTARSTFILSCHGNGSVHWTITAFRLQYPDPLQNPVKVMRSDPRHTGTYICRYTNRSLEHLNSWVHLYVSDPDDPSSAFVIPRSTPTLQEGMDFLFRCLLTDPSITNLTLQSENRGRGLPPGMNVTFDPRRGALIRDLQMSFKGRYVCSGWKDRRQVTSAPVDLLVVPRLRVPPHLSISQDEFVRLEGELFEVTCLTSNPTHFFNLTWTHPHIQNLNVTLSRYYSNRQLYINGTLVVSGVGQSHAGPYTCTAVNEAGVSMATAQLTVLDRPYLRIYLQAVQPANANTSTVGGNGNLLPNVSRKPTDVEEEISRSTLFVNVSNKGRDTNEANGAKSANRLVEVYEGKDMILTFVMDAYPPIRSQHWTTPPQLNNTTVHQESYTVNGYRSEASLLLHRVRQEDRGRYSFYFSNLFFNGSQNIDLRIYRSPTAAITLNNDTLTCSSSGYPLPTILWFPCPGFQRTCGNVSRDQLPPGGVMSHQDEEEEEEEEEEQVKISLPLSTVGSATVQCVASNFLGESRQFFTGSQSVFTPPLIGCLSAAIVLLLLLLVVFYKCRQKPKYEIRWKIIESSDGNNYTFIDPSRLPYSHKWEFPRDKLRLGAVLGSGAFGKVVEATAFGLGTDNEETRVAVKMLKPSALSEEREALMSELKILSHLGYHDNIVNLLGACTRGGPMLVITEYCCHGDLLNFLRAHAPDFLPSLKGSTPDEASYRNVASEQRLRSDSGISCCSEYQEMQPILSPGQTSPSKNLDSPGLTRSVSLMSVSLCVWSPGVETDGLYVGDLIRFSYHVAQGLEFLSSRNCLHRDVAARNVLLTDRRVAKICDFGLARDIRNDDSYIVHGNARLPVKWMAPESIFQCVYTVQSDVWSYGVLLWEIFSLGKSPYPNVAVDTNFYKMIKDGCHMDQPDFAPAEMYQLMTLCWSLEPTNRPTFKMIGQVINRLLPSTNDMALHHMDQPTYKNIDECREELEEEGEEEARTEMVKGRQEQKLSGY